MNRRSVLASVLGAAGGVAAGLLLLALGAVLVVEQSVVATVIEASRDRARADFVTNDWTMFWLVAVMGAVVGALIGRVAIALADTTHPDEARLRAVPLMLGSAVLGGVTAYAMLRAGLGLGADIVADPAAGVTTVTVSVFRMIAIVAVAGATTGSVVAVSAEWLSRPSVVGLGGEAWHESRTSFVREATAAMMIPLLALAVVAVVVFLFSRLLLLEPGVFAVTVFSLGAAVVLGVAAFFAYLGGRRPTSGE